MTWKAMLHGAQADREAALLVAQIANNVHEENALGPNTVALRRLARPGMSPTPKGAVVPPLRWDTLVERCTWWLDGARARRGDNNACHPSRGAYRRPAKAQQDVRWS